MTPLQARLLRISNRIDAISERTGQLAAWLVPLMVVIIGYDITMRYLFRIGSVALQELEWHLFALVFLLGAAYTLKHDGHVRVDIFYRSRFLNDRQRAWIEVLGTLLFLIPFCVLIIASAWPFVMNSFAMGEGSPDAGGLPYRYLLKAAIPLGFFLLLLQGIANMLRAVVLLLSPAQATSEASENSEVPTE